MLVPELVHEYAGVRVPSSASLPDAEQVNVVPTTTLEVGEIDGVPTIGGVFSTVTDAEADIDEELLSVAVAVQTTSALDKSEAETV